MAFVKSKLKAARDALTKKDYVTASEASSAVLEYEPENYNANVFLGLSLLELGKHDESEKAYRRAVELNPNQPLAWQGLSKFYEKTENWKQYEDTLNQLIDLYNKTQDSVKCAETWQKLLELRRERSTKPEIADTLALLLPNGTLYPLLSTLPFPNSSEPQSSTTLKAQMTLHHSLDTLKEIVDMLEAYEDDHVRREVEKRRTRLGARGPEIIRKEVGRELWGSSKLPYYFNEIISHPNTTDELRRATERSLLRYKERYLQSIPNDPQNATQKAATRDEIDKLVEGVITLHIPDDLAWKLYLEAQDNDTILSYPTSLIREFLQLFPSAPLAPILRGYYLYYDEPLFEGEDEDEDEKTDDSPEQSKENVIDSILDAFTTAPDSLVATRAMVEIYVAEADFENAEKVIKSGLELVKRISDSTGRSLPRVTKQLKVALATVYVHMFPPKYHAQALQLVDEVLSEDTDNVSCLMGRGYIMESSGKWEDAATLFERATNLTTNDTIEGLRTREEHGWCLCHIGQAQAGIEELNNTLETLKELGNRSQDVARVTWRIGDTRWKMGGSKQEEAYALFIAALKANPAFAPAFTSLGVYYEEFVSPPDLSRASKCFQKAFELDPREADAARRLAEGFAKDREWDLVEVVARRTIEGEGAQAGGKVSVASRYIPQNAWAWKALGAVEFHRHNYDAAINAFQVTLRGVPDDGISWMRLGEAYNRAGRHMAAIKALEKARELQPDDWMPIYLTGEVKQRMGLYQEAIDALNLVLTSQPSETGVLLSLGQAYLDQGRSELADGFHARSEDSFLNAITIGLRALKESPGFRSISWKIIGDSIFSMSGATHYGQEEGIREALSNVSGLFPEDLQYLQGLSLQTVRSQTSPCTSSDGLRVATAVYCYRAILASGDTGVARNGSAWYDLGICLQSWSTRYPSDAIPGSNEKVIFFLNKALKEDPGNSLFWAGLGDAYFLDKPKVAQHAYVKSLEIDSKAVSTWTKLGLLYLQHDDVELANEAFYRAQTLDPDFAGAWLGQAIVATINGHHHEADAMLGHAVTLPSNLPQGDLEYASRSLKNMNSSTSYDPKVRLDILLPSFHVLDRYTRGHPADTTGLHLFALVCEGLGHLELGVTLATKAIGLLEASYEETEDPEVERRYTIANVTVARLLMSLQRYQEACGAFETATGLLSSSEEEDTFTQTLKAQARLGLGLASFLGSDLHTALTTLESALEETTAEMPVHGQLTVLLAKTMWAIGTDETRESAKNLLLECITVDPENLLAVNTLAGMGILTDDDSLVDAALSELLSLPIQQRLELDPEREVDYLLAQHHLAQDDYAKALSVRQRSLLSDPANAVVRNTLATLLLQGQEAKPAQAILGTDGSRDTQALPAILQLKSVAFHDENAQSIRDIQRAIKLSPWTSRNWETLAFTTAR